MTSETKAKLYTDKDLSYERVFEVRIRDLRERNGMKQKSFSVLVKQGTKDDEYPSVDELKEILENKIHDS